MQSNSKGNETTHHARQSKNGEQKCATTTATGRITKATTIVVASRMNEQLAKLLRGLDDQTNALQAEDKLEIKGRN